MCFSLFSYALVIKHQRNLTFIPLFQIFYLQRSNNLAVSIELIYVFLYLVTVFHKTSTQSYVHSTVPNILPSTHFLSVLKSSSEIYLLLHPRWSLVPFAKSPQDTARTGHSPASFCLHSRKGPISFVSVPQSSSSSDLLSHGYLREVSKHVRKLRTLENCHMLSIFRILLLCVIFLLQFV